MTEKIKLETCANCSTDFDIRDHGTRFATILFRESISTIRPNTITNEESLKKDPTVLKKRARVVLCPTCSEFIETKINSGKLVEYEVPDIYDASIQTKKLEDFLIAHDAFFPCVQLRSYIGRVKGRHEKFDWDLDWKERKRLNHKRHFDLEGTKEGEILKIRGFRGEQEIYRFILVSVIEKYWLCYYNLSEEQVLMAFPKEELELEEIPK